MTAPGAPWTPEEDGLLRSIGAAGESVATIATLLKRSPHAVRKRAYSLKDQVSPFAARAEGEEETVVTWATGERHKRSTSFEEWGSKHRQTSARSRAVSPICIAVVIVSWRSFQRWVRPPTNLLGWPIK